MCGQRGHISVPDRRECNERPPASLRDRLEFRRLHIPFAQVQYSGEYKNRDQNQQHQKEHFFGARHQGVLQDLQAKGHLEEAKQTQHAHQQQNVNGEVVLESKPQVEGKDGNEIYPIQEFFQEHQNIRTGRASQYELRREPNSAYNIYDLNDRKSNYVVFNVAVGIQAKGHDRNDDKRQ